MIEDMPRPRPPHLQKQITRHGKTVWYVRLGRGPKVRIRGDYGSPEFNTAYDEAINGKRPQKPGTIKEGTLQWVLDLYRESKAWRDLSLATRRQRENIFKPVLKTAGPLSIKFIDAQAIDEGIERRKPNQARHFVDAMRGFFKWAVSKNLATIDPTTGYKVSKPKSEGFPAWTEEDATKFRERWPLGTRERVMFEVFSCTGLRRGDAAKLGRQHMTTGIIVVDTEKTGTRVEIPILDDLADAIKAGPVGDLAIIATKAGGYFIKEGLGNEFSDACRKAGIRKSAHGLRKLAATRLANAGATVAQLEAIFGWVGGRMASHYTRTADRRKLAEEGMKKLRQKGGRRVQNNR